MAPEAPPQGSAHRDMFTDIVIQEFITWVEDHKSPGATFKSNLVEGPSFVPDSAIKEYFSCYRDSDHERVKRLVEAATKHSSTPANAKAIAQNCPKIFTILVLIGRSPYISNFVQNARLHDRHLPFRADEARLFPRLEGGTTFFELFDAHQWQFCVEPMTQSLEPVQFDDPIILPIVRMEELDKGAGASAVVRKIVVHEDYDGLGGPAGDGGRDQQRAFPEPHVYVVKSYHRQDAERYFDAEVDAFRKLNETGRPVQNLIGFHGAFKQNKSFNVILQFANIGTLEDYFRKARPPKDEEDVLSLWRNIFKLVDALVDIHDLPQISGPEQVRIFQGWHQDIKPANILVAGNLDENPYEVLFMLGDLGLTHFTAVVEDQAGLAGEEKSGTRAYNSPEINLAKSSITHFEKQVKQKNDTWALACVFSEVNTWVVEGLDGKYGLHNYRTQRQIEADAQGDSMGSCFHNHRGFLLDTVEKWHNHLPSRSARQDNVTDIIWDELLKYIFKASGHRLTASQVQHYSETVIQNAQSLPRTSPIRREATYSSFARDLPTFNSPPKTPPEVPPEYQDSGGLSMNYVGYLLTPPYSNQPKRSQTLGLHPAQGTQGSERFNVTGSPPLMLQSREVPSPIANRRDTLEARGPGPEDLQRPFSADLEHTRVENSQVAVGGHSGAPSRNSAYEQFYTQPDVVGTEQELPVKSQTQLFTRPTVHENVGQHRHQLSGTSSLELSDVRSAIAELSDGAESKGKEKAVQEPHSPSKKSNQPAKHLSIEELRAWAKKTREASSSLFGQREFSLSFEDELLGELKKRDHIFIIDDAKSMAAYWSQMESLFADLIYLIKKKRLDPNGSELQFIMSDKRKEAKDTSELVQMVERMGRQVRGATNFAARLDEIWDVYRKKLENKKKSARPMSLYVLTNGVWQPGNSQREGVASVIQRMVRDLEATSAKGKMVGIQFIRFGDDVVGKERLNWLDAKLPKAWSLARDICDTTRADGNVWKMLLGSINGSWDDEEED